MIYEIHKSDFKSPVRKWKDSETFGIDNFTSIPI